MGTTVRDVLVNALENLGKKGLKKFTCKLQDFEVDERYKKITKNKLEDKDCDEIANVIREYYKDVYGVEVTLAVLDVINEKNVAKELERDLTKVDGFERLTQSEGSGDTATPIARPVTTSLCDNGEIKYSLTLERYYPRYIQIEWTCGVGDVQETLSCRNHYTEQADKTFTVCSEVRITENLLRNPDWRVCVTWDHQHTYSNGRQELTVRHPDFLWTPVVEEIQTPRLFHNTPVALECTVSGYFPDALAVTWLRRRERKLEICEESDDVSVPKIKSYKSPDNTYRCIAKLMLTPTLRDHQGAEYICQVQHPSLENAIKKSSGRLSMMAKPQPEPMKMTLEDEGFVVRFSLQLKMFYPKELNIRWHWDETQPRRGVRQGTRHTETFTEREDDCLFDVTSECGILGCGFVDPQYKFYVTWYHASMEGPETRELTVRDLPWHPEVDKIISLEMLDNEETKLYCNISGYYPHVIAVSWLKKGKGDVSAVPVSNGCMSEVIHHKEKRRDHSYRCSSTLCFTPTVREDQGAEYICRVEHPSLEHPLESSTGPLNIRVFCPPHVSEIITPRLEDNKQVTLTCYISKYFPDLLFSVQWFRKEAGSRRDLPNDRYKISHCRSYNWDDQTYAHEVNVTFTPVLSSDQGVELICVVEHDLLEQPIERSTGPLDVSVISTGT
ncbi:uncharacterized protein LOC134945849 [Pseudophryne corroboree]|uniref:uncharacterized protein LOC134945849 n=1 Tax=Pseudophryne corroboree TaxID=495146 RepID=UPI003081C86F